MKNIYTNLGPPLEPKQVTVVLYKCCCILMHSSKGDCVVKVAIHRKFIQTCFDYLRESYSELSGLKQELDAEDQSIATVHTTRMVRCLKLLREYIAECDAAHEDERAILPHGKLVHVEWWHNEFVHVQTLIVLVLFGVYQLCVNLCV